MTRQGIKELALASHALNQRGWGTWPLEIPSMTYKKQPHTKQELAPSMANLRNRHKSEFHSLTQSSKLLHFVAWFYDYVVSDIFRCP